MISKFFHLIFFDPLYNLLIALSAFLPGHDLGAAIIILTILVKTALLPLQHQALTTQKRMKLLEPKLQEIKKQYNHDRGEQAKQIMALYREHQVNPFSTFWTLLLQFPIILALFWVFRDSTTLHPEFLYSFTPLPVLTTNIWLGLIDLTRSYFPLALVVGLSQFWQLWLASAAPAHPSNANQPVSANQELMQNMNRQMKYWLPVFVVFASATLPAAISLYWITSNLFSVASEIIVHRRLSRAVPPTPPAIQ